MGEHKTSESKPLGIVDFIAGAVCFLIVAFLMKALVTTAVPGLLREDTFYQILQSGFLFLAVWVLFLNRLFQKFFDAFEQRELLTLGAKEEASRLLVEASSIEKELEAEIQKTRFKALQENEVLVEEAKKEADKVIAAANSKATQQYEHSLSNITAMKKKADGDLDAEVVKLTKLFKESALKPAGRTLH